MIKFDFFPRTEAFRPDNPDHWRSKLHLVIFGTDTRAGKRFDAWLLVAILVSVAVVMLESVKEIRQEWGFTLLLIEWMFTALFTVEYILRFLAVRRPIRYATSFFGLIDLFSILPTFIAFFIPGAAPLLAIRILRMLRVFRIFRLISFLHEASSLIDAMRASRRKISVFIASVLTIVVVLGTLMYIIEDDSAGFTSIPRSIYWAIVTLTTVGYGDIAPTSAFGQAMAALIMLLGYSIIAIPTGIVSSEMTRQFKDQKKFTCHACGSADHNPRAKFCGNCGEELNSE